MIDAGELLQHVSRVVYRGSPLYFGRSGTNRYDDPAGTQGVLYLGRDLPTALMESVFHKHQWLEDTKRSIALFERAEAKISVVEDIDLVDHVDWPRFVATCRIGVEPDPGPVKPEDEATYPFPIARRFFPGRVSRHAIYRPLPTMNAAPRLSSTSGLSCHTSHPSSDAHSRPV